ncbi:MAG TPA: PAS domain-containing protein [Polyangiaceae bacterium]|jgi:rsbT co-antagonist protein RsbR|nr:PAS domain-containing protein [Polyangiaceae bacterium]
MNDVEGDSRLDAMTAELEALRRKTTEIERSEAELRSYLAAMNDVIIVTDWEGRYLKIAPTSPELLFKPTDELLGKTIHEVLPKEVADELVSNVRCAIEMQQAMSMEYCLTIGGMDRWFLGSLLPMPEGRALFIGRDITERKQIEDALRLKQEEVIRNQAAALADLLTPLIPITDDIVVMPLIGLVDSQRAQQVMDTLLAGIAERRASVAILDVTGVSVVDTMVASVLIRVAKAVNLLGAQVVLTGIRPEVARTLVGIGAELTGIQTHGTLQSAIAHAMSHAVAGG